jgi:hypothetical protein
MVHAASLRCALALLIVACACACAGCGSSGPAKVNVASYVKSVCSAISPLERDVSTRSKALNGSASTNAAQAKRTLQGFLTAIEQDSEHALSRIRAAGTPDINHGSAVSAAIVRAFTQLRDAMRSASTKAGALPINSTPAYNAAAKALNVGVRASLNNIDPSGFSNPDIEKAAAKEPACKSLNS